ncbi:MAG: glycosyltransferase [Candidatus Omnitrophica bacterium]|nr:glycosyltransferase [Candidatus Omnitrophota bacterium]
MSNPLVSIIIPAKNAEKTLARCLDSLLVLDYDNYEIIIIDDFSQDETPVILSKYLPKINIITNPVARGPSFSRNVGVFKARGEFFAFTDADCIVDKNWLKELLAGFALDGVISCGGSQDVPADETDFGKKVYLAMKKIGFISDYLRKSGEGILSVDHNPTCNVMYKKEAFRQEGGFLEELWPGEDVEFDFRLKKRGYRIVFNPKALVYHYKPQDTASFLRMMDRYGWAQGFLVKKYGIFRKIQAVPIIIPLVLVFILGLLIYKLFLTGILVFLCFISLLFYFNFKLTALGLALKGIISWHLGFYKAFMPKT